VSAAAVPHPRAREVPGEGWARRVVGAWAVLMLASDLKVTVFLYIHWVATLIAILLLWSYLGRVHWWTWFPARRAAILFLIAVAVPTLYGAKVLYSFAEVVKLAAILLGGMSFFVARRQLAEKAFANFPIIVWANLALLAGGLLGAGTAGEMALSRWGTVINFPGTLWRVSASVWVFAAYLLVRRRSLSALALFAGSTLLVYADGARTALVLLVAGAIFLVLVLAAEAGHLRRALIISVAGLAVVAGAVAYSGILSGQDGGDEEGALGRMQQMASNFAQGTFEEGLLESDIVRFQMLLDVVNAIRTHPILGTGIGTTVSDTVLGPMPVHMTYLQVWADLGLLGLLAYIWLVWGWIAWLPRSLRRIRTLPSPALRAAYYNAVFLLLMFGLAGFFHPLSTEWTEWILFIVPYAMVWHLAQPQKAA
jgi:O-antigen ligase